MTSILLLIATFAFGTIIGSFMNVVIFRVPRKRSPAKGRSKCPNCNHQLGYHDLFPILSYILLLGKCRYCRKGISWQYPIVELVCGLLFAASAYWVVTHGPHFNIVTILTIVFWWMVIAVSVALFTTDLLHYLLPNSITYPAIIAALIFVLLISAITDNGLMVVLFPRLMALLFAGLTFIAIFYISEGRWMGGGDVKYIIFMCLVLGFPEILIGLFAAFVSGAMVAVVLMLAGKKTRKSTIPFGTFLTVATIFALFFGAPILLWLQEYW